MGERASDTDVEKVLRSESDADADAGVVRDCVCAARMPTREKKLDIDSARNLMFGQQLRRVKNGQVKITFVVDRNAQFPPDMLKERMSAGKTASAECNRTSTRSERVQCRMQACFHVLI